MCLDNNKVVLILSGGLDSTTVLYKLLNEGKDVIALSFNYGQKALIEIKKAEEICKLNNVPHHIFDIKSIAGLLSSSLTETDNNKLYQSKDTVVPSRNTILLSLATAFAISNNRSAVYYGAIKADVGDYPDTTPEFLEKMNELNKVNNYEYIPIKAPFIDFEKYEVVIEALKLGVPIEKTWSCYINNDRTPCGECFSCKSRIKAIEIAKEKIKK